MRRFLIRFSMRKKAELLRAARKGCLQEVRALIDAGVSPNARGFFKETALMAAVQGEHRTVVRFLIEAGADPMAKDEDGDTAFKMAERNGCCDIVSLLHAFEMLSE